MLGGEYGNLSALEAAMACLRDLEGSLSETEIMEIKTGYSSDYDVMRKIHQIDGIQRVIVLNKGSLHPFRIPQLWQRDKT